MSELSRCRRRPLLVGSTVLRDLLRYRLRHQPQPCGPAMPVFNLICPGCGIRLRKLLPRMTDDLPCPNCTVKLARDGEGPTTRVIEVRDNGVMPKKVEQLADIDELIKNR